MVWYGIKGINGVNENNLRKDLTKPKIRLIGYNR